MPVIDFHAHVLEAGVLARCFRRNIASGFGAVGLPQPGSRAGDLHRTMLDPAAHIADMDRFGIDVAVISLSTVIAGGQWATPEEDLELNRRANDHIAARVRDHRARLVGAFSLPLQDLGRSLGELERCTGELGLRVVALPACARGVYLGSPTLAPLWEAIAGAGLVAFVHPDGVTDPWFQDYSLWNSIGQPIEETKTMSSLIYEGVLDRWPELAIVMAHGGGYLPHYFGRHDRNVANRPETARNISRLPSDYLRLFHYDTCVYTPHVLEELVELAGADHVLMGSDYPMGEADPVAFVGRAANVGGEEAALIRGGAAAALLRRAGALS